MTTLRALEPYVKASFVALQMYLAHVAGVAAVEGVRQAQDCRQPPDRFAVLFAERAIVRVTFLRRCAPVIARHVGDDIALGFGKACQLRMLDEIQRMLVMRFVRDVIANIMK
jgi:hypothetical protein